MAHRHDHYQGHSWRRAWWPPQVRIWVTSPGSPSGLAEVLTNMEENLECTIGDRDDEYQWSWALLSSGSCIHFFHLHLVSFSRRGDQAKTWGSYSKIGWDCDRKQMDQAAEEADYSGCCGLPSFPFRTQHCLQDPTPIFLLIAHHWTPPQELLSASWRAALAMVMCPFPQHHLCPMSDLCGGTKVWAPLSSLGPLQGAIPASEAPVGAVTVSIVTTSNSAPLVQPAFSSFTGDVPVCLPLKPAALKSPSLSLVPGQLNMRQQPLGIHGDSCSLLILF